MVVQSEATVPRRSSSRVQTMNNNKEAARLRRKEEEPSLAKEPPVKKRQRVNKKGESSSTGNNHQILNEALGNGVVEAEPRIEEAEMRPQQAVVVAAEGPDGESAYAKVTNTIRNFYKHFLHFVQVEERRCAKDDDQKKVKKSKSNNQVVVEERSKAKRPDLKALSLMMATGLVYKPPRRIGSIPGVDVGHQFFSRCEMVTVGFHNHWLCGIDYIGASSKDYPGYRLPLTVAIVMSGQYEDDIDNSEKVIYTGQGGNNLLGNKRQIGDQAMTRGNLGLKNCQEQNVPVRVIRGHQSKTSYVGKVYTFDGLYMVEKYWAEKGVSGFTVYKFLLKRVEGQPLLQTEQVYFSRERIPDSVSDIRGLVVEDISGGLENIPIPATNLVDDPPVPPTGLTYIKSLQVSSNVKLPKTASGCNCNGNCTDPNRCACARLNSAKLPEFPYVHRDGGRLIEPKSVVFECGPNCGCGPGCVNRTSQKGLRYRLEVYKTPNKGWAVRSWDFIPSGAPVCEYIGVLKRTEDVDSNPENNYIFDIDCLQTMKGLGRREKRVGEVAMPSSLEKDDDKDNGPEFCIDAGTIGNVTRYINHSCQPNLFVQCVLSTHHDITQARIILFAADNIPPLKELTYDYGYEMDSVLGPDGEIKQLACFCGAPDCRKRLF